MNNQTLTHLRYKLYLHLYIFLVKVKQERSLQRIHSVKHIYSHKQYYVDICNLNTRKSTSPFSTLCKTALSYFCHTYVEIYQQLLTECQMHLPRA